MEIKVLGSGCANCKRLLEYVQVDKRIIYRCFCHIRHRLH